MKKFELILGLIAILAIFLKLLHLPGSGVLTVLTLSMLSVFYFWFSFAFFNGIRLRDIFNNEPYMNINTNRIIGAIGVGFALSIITVGVLFKLQFWPGGSIQLVTGLVTAGLILLIAVFFYSRSKAEYYTRVFKRIIIFGGLGLIVFLTPTSTIVDIYYRHNTGYAELYKKVLSNPENIELREQLEQMRIEILEKELQDDLESKK